MSDFDAIATSMDAKLAATFGDEATYTPDDGPARTHLGQK